MQRRQVIQALGLLACGGQAFARDAAGQTLADRSPLDLMPTFWRVYDAGRNASVAARIAGFATGLFLSHADQYTAAGFNGAGTHGRLLDRRVAAWLVRVDEIVGPVRAVSDALPVAWTMHEARFATAGLRLPAKAGECFMPSLFAFTGYSRVWDQRPLLFIAPDGVVAQLGAGADLAVLLDHEAFHLYHDQTVPDLTGPLVWMRLWREGLATFASSRLNPSATEAQVLMGADLAAAPASAVAAAAQQALGTLDSGEATPWLFDAGQGRGLPDRIGYLLGLRIVQRLAGQRSLAQLAQLPAAAVRPGLAAALAELDRGR